MLRILMVSEIRLYREGVAGVLARREGFASAQTAGSAEETLARLDQDAPDVVLLDTGLPGALPLVREIGDRSAATKVVMLGLAEVEGDVVAFAEAGIAGYVDREASIEELVDVVRSAMREELCCSRKVAGALVRRLATLALERGGTTDEVQLSPRELEVVSLLDQGRTNKEIARDLGIEVTTAKNHVHNILEKLEVHTRGEAVAKVRALRRYGLSESWRRERRKSPANPRREAFA